jgi:hypothetical protein
VIGVASPRDAASPRLWDGNLGGRIDLRCARGARIPQSLAGIQVMFIVGIEAVVLFSLVVLMWFVLFKRRVHPSDKGLAVPATEDKGRTTLRREHDEPPGNTHP